MLRYDRTFLLADFDGCRVEAVVADAGAGNRRHAELVLLALVQVRHCRVLAGDREVVHLLPVSSRLPLLDLVTCSNSYHTE